MFEFSAKLFKYLAQQYHEIQGGNSYKHVVWNLECFQAEAYIL
jgi:hypothetical protein